MDGSIATAVTVNGGMLGGSGTIGGLTVNDGGVLSPGSSPGILHVKGNLSLALGANYLVELNGPTAGSEYDQTDVMGAVSLGNATLSLVLGFIPADGTTFTIINNDLTDPVTGMFNHLTEGAIFKAGGTSFAISYGGGDGNDVVLTSAGSSSVPDAGQTGFLLSVSTVALLAVRRLTTSRA